ncbi:family 10 glycosylhydrolase [Paenibacillus sp. N10]|uniref:Family 10 glycosylhydrolase n=2 Tax=Paenibacillus lutrae TaxID=2078573 RepID=A0A7X3K1Q7_9BACL|nr:family 10 glycosylhydrolase [Paenibacillus lutrae]
MLSVWNICSRAYGASNDESGADGLLLQSRAYPGFDVPPDSPKAGRSYKDMLPPRPESKRPPVPGKHEAATVNESVYGPHVKLPDGTFLPVAGVDQTREQNKLSVFTNTYGTYTTSFDTNTIELILTGGIVADKVSVGTKGTYIPRNGYVLSGSGNVKGLLQALNIGDSVQTVHMQIPVLPEKYVRIGDLVLPIDKVNGTRYEGEAVLYHSSYGTKTRTNAWGLEATILNGMIVSVRDMRMDGSGQFADNNSPIPPEGYVLSVQSLNPCYQELLKRAVPGTAVIIELENDYLYQASTIGFDAFNPRKREDNPAGWDDGNRKPLPGMRGAEQFIVYDSGYGSSSGTNPWGSEVVVNAAGKIIGIGGNNRSIPAGGYVLSGHGSYRTWLTRYAAIGARVVVNRAEKQVMILWTPQSLLDKAQITAAKAELALEESKRLFLDVPYDKLRKQIDTVKKLREEAGRHLSEKGIVGLAQILKDLDRTATSVRSMNVESRSVENRGIWLRPKENSIEEVRQAMDKIEGAHINQVFVETFWNGYTIFPTKNKITMHNPVYNGFDVLAAYLAEGKKRGIEIHAWVENFFAGGPEPGPVIKNKPEWSLLSRKGLTYQEDVSSGFRYYYINPALNEVHDFLINVYQEILSSYDVDGLHLDYARYPGSGDYTNDFGYDLYTRGLFKKRYGADPLTLKPGDKLWEEWVTMRVGFVNKFVLRLTDEVKKIKPGVKVTAAVWPEYELAREDVLQDSMNWVANNRIDNVYPMSYKLDTSLVLEDARRTFELVKNKAYVTIGVGSFIHLTKEAFVDQIVSSHVLGISGSAIFEYESFIEGGYDKETAVGVYRQQAIVPDASPAHSLVRILQDQKSKINRIYVPLGGMNHTAEKWYSKQLDEVVQKLGGDKKPKLNPGRIKEIKKSLLRVIDTIQQNRGMHEEVKARALYDLRGALQIVEVTISKMGQKM